MAAAVGQGCHGAANSVLTLSVSSSASPSLPHASLSLTTQGFFLSLRGFYPFLREETALADDKREVAVNRGLSKKPHHKILSMDRLSVSLLLTQWSMWGPD